MVIREVGGGAVPHLGYRGMCWAVAGVLRLAMVVQVTRCSRHMNLGFRCARAAIAGDVFCREHRETEDRRLARQSRPTRNFKEPLLLRAYGFGRCVRCNGKLQSHDPYPLHRTCREAKLEEARARGYRSMGLL